MNKEKLSEHFKELKEQIQSFFNRKTLDAGKEALKEHRNQVLREIRSHGHILDEHPVYGAVAFLGKFQFDTGCPKVKALAKGSSVQLLEEIRAKKTVRVEEGASEAWKYLLAHKPEALSSVLALCYLASRNRSITSRI